MCRAEGELLDSGLPSLARTEVAFQHAIHSLGHKGALCSSGSLRRCRASRGSGRLHFPMGLEPGKGEINGPITLPSASPGGSAGTVTECFSTLPKLGVLTAVGSY